MQLDEARAVAERLLGRPVATAEAGGGGGNSRLVRVVAADGTPYALKLYPPLSADPRDRLGAEAGALAFLRGEGVALVPALIGADRQANAALLEWIDGTLAERDVDGEGDVDRLVEVTAAFHRARHAAGARALPPASEAVLKGTDLLDQVDKRFARLSAVAADHAGLSAFLDAKVMPAIARWRGAMERGYAEAGQDIAAPVADPTLSPSDFGFHNALRRPDGSLVFIDFEYFGWDDPVKLVADTLLHPRLTLAPGPKARLAEGLSALYDDDPFFRRRLALQTPLFGLRWVAILLNEFLPEKWAVRAHAGAAEREAAQARQLAKAETLFETLSRNHDQV